MSAVAEAASVLDAYYEGMAAGNKSVAAGLNPYSDVHSPEYEAWERGRQGAASVIAARMVA